jgi:hypothetical protein
MDMNFYRTGKEIFDKTVPQTATYSRTSKATVKRAFELFIKHKLINVVSRQARKTGVYEPSDFLKSRLTMSPELSTVKESGLTMSPALGSPRAENNEIWAHHEPVVREACKDSKKERAQKAAPLSPDFSPDEKTLDYIEKKLCIDDSFVDDIGEAFMEYFLDSGEARKDWQFECRKWFKREAEMKGNKILARAKSPEKVYETQKKPEDRAMTDEERQRAKEQWANIMANFKGQGVKLNGLLGNDGRHEGVHKKGT